jgi:hypothetical protein
VLKDEFPTPSATPYGTNQGGQKAGHARPSIETHFRQLATSAPAGECFSTPTREDGERGGKPRTREGGPDLTSQLATFPSPAAGDAESHMRYPRGNPSLEATLWATATSSNGGEAKSAGYSSPTWTPGETLADQVGTSSKLALNAEWVCALMGFPPGWADLPAILRYRRQDS